MTRAPANRGDAGFSLLEALVSVAMLGVVLAILGVIAGQWLPRWRAGYERLERAELVGLALDRIVADLSAAEFIEPVGEKRLFFIGDGRSATLVRTPVGPRPSSGPAPTGLEIVRLAGAAEGGLTRSRAPFTPQTRIAENEDEFPFSDASQLLRPPFFVAFAYAGADRVWSERWSSVSNLPTAVRVTLRDSRSDEILAISTATLLHVDAPASCVAPGASAQCVGAAKGAGAPGGEPEDAAGAAQAGVARGGAGL